LKLNKAKIKSELKRLGWSEAAFAMEMGLSRQAVNYYFNPRYNKHRPNFGTVEKIAKILKLDPKDLII